MEEIQKGEGLDVYTEACDCMLPGWCMGERWQRTRIPPPGRATQARGRPRHHPGMWGAEGQGEQVLGRRRQRHQH